MPYRMKLQMELKLAIQPGRPQLAKILQLVVISTSDTPTETHTEKQEMDTEQVITPLTDERAKANKDHLKALLVTRQPTVLADTA